MSQSSPKSRCLQIREEELVTHLELYIRSLHRVRAQKQECLAAEPARAVKARTPPGGFVCRYRWDGSSAEPRLDEALQCLKSYWLMAFENVGRVIRRRIVSEYEHQTRLRRSPSE
jgi:hypothetical protein